MNAKLLEIVLERLTESQLPPEESNLVLAACQGDEALQAVRMPASNCQLQSGARTFPRESLFFPRPISLEKTVIS